MSYKHFKSIYKHSDYLFEINYFSVDYEFGKKWIDEHYNPSYHGCSSVNAGKFYGRNLDWYYDYGVEFVVNIPKGSGVKYASHSVCSLITSLNTAYMRHANFSDDIFKAIPFACVDGQNEKGLIASSNVIPLEESDHLIETVPTKELKDKICMSMMVRYILDHYATVDECVKDLKENISIYSNEKLFNMGLGAHIMVKDRNKSVCLEFVDNEIKVIDTNYLTNYNLYNVIFNEDNTVYTPETQDELHDAILTNHIQAHGQGLERWNLIAENYSSLHSKEDITNLMHDLDYRKAYLSYSEVSDPYWYTEFTGRNLLNDVKVNSPVEEYQYITEIAATRFTNRNRNQGTNGTWHTTHTSIYDNQSLTLYFYDSSEDEVEHVFYFPKKKIIKDKIVAQLYERAKFYIFNVKGGTKEKFYRPSIVSDQTICSDYILCGGNSVWFENISIASGETICSSNTICGNYDILYLLIEKGEQINYEI